MGRVCGRFQVQVSMGTKFYLLEKKKKKKKVFIGYIIPVNITLCVVRSCWIVIFSLLDGSSLLKVFHISFFA